MATCELCDERELRELGQVVTTEQYGATYPLLAQYQTRRCQCGGRHWRLSVRFDLSGFAHTSHVISEHIIGIA